MTRMNIEVSWQPAPEHQEFEGILLDGSMRFGGLLLNQGEGRLRLTGKAMVTCAGKCSRCLTPVQRDLAFEVEADYIPVGRLEEEETEREIPCFTYRGHLIDLEAAVAEFLYPALPLRLLCHEDCQGLCPHCGGDRNAVPCDCEERRKMEASPFGILKNLL